MNVFEIESGKQITQRTVSSLSQSYG